MLCTCGIKSMPAKNEKDRRWGILAGKESGRESELLSQGVHSLHAHSSDSVSWSMQKIKVKSSILIGAGKKY